MSVVIPAYRRPDMVERALRSVARQTRRPSEVIVVDDASGDETPERARALGARVIVHERNQGEGPARNSGIEAASHEWVALLDCDDEWLPYHLETLWEHRDGHAVVGAAMLTCGSTEPRHRVYGWGGRRPCVLRSPAEVAVPENKLPSSTTLVRRDAVLTAGGFRPLRHASDLDLWVRLLDGATGLAVPKVTGLYYVHGEQISADLAAMDAAHRAVLDAYADRPWCTGSVLRRHEGVVAWDEARAALRDGAPPAHVLPRLALRLVRPARAAGVLSLLGGRFGRRRVAARLAPGGTPSVAILPGGSADAAPAGAIDLRPGGWPCAIARLARRPPAHAVVEGFAPRLLVRALGVEPVRGSAARAPRAPARRAR